MTAPARIVFPTADRCESAAEFLRGRLERGDVLLTAHPATALISLLESAARELRDLRGERP